MRLVDAVVMLSSKRLRPRRSFELAQCLHRRVMHIRIRVPEHRNDGGGVLLELNRLQLAKRINPPRSVQ